METHNLKVHLKELSEARNELEPYKNLRDLEDIPFKLGLLTDPVNQKLCSGQQVRNTKLRCDFKFLSYSKTE